jgi:hypothetical protein
MSTRREALKKMATLSAVALVAPKVFAEKRRGGGAAAGGDANLPLVEPGKGMAASVNYFHRHEDIKDAKLKADRQGVKWEKQYCNNCMLYTKVGNKNGEEVGKCTLFQGQLVKGQGWCASWAKKA